MNATKYSILITIYAILVKGKKHYITPSPTTILSLLRKFHGITIHPRWMFQCIADLGASGHIHRQARWFLTSDQEIRRLPQLVSLTTAGVTFLSRRYVAGARTLLKRMISWIHRDDARFPRPADLTPSKSVATSEDALTHIKEILKVLS